jgi:diguanylate cyclase (GGDEF)-like protein
MPPTKAAGTASTTVRRGTVGWSACAWTSPNCATSARLQTRRHRDPRGPELQELPGNRWLRVDEQLTRDGGVAGVRTEVTELVRREQQLTELNAKLAVAHAKLEELSETDALTGIANRRRFDRRLQEDWTRVVRYGTTLWLVLVDIDHFKPNNDRLGHQDGDQCLRRVAQALAGCASRPTDVVARYGGEEFAILLPHVQRDEAMALALRCVQAVDAVQIAHPESPTATHVTISAGVAWVSGGHPAQPDTLLRAADAALYRAKAAGRHRAEVAFQ